MKWIQSSIIIVSLTFLATCFADKNEATIRGLKDKKGSKVSIKSSKSKSDKSSKFSNKPKPGLEDTKGSKVSIKSSKSKSDKSSKFSKNQSKTLKGKKGRSGSKSAKSCKFEKSSKDFNRVIEEYVTYKDMSMKRTGLTSFLDPVVDNTIEFEADYVSICLEDAVVECSRRCAEEDGKCTMFEVSVNPDVTDDDPTYYCYMINNNVNDFNPRRIYPTSELSLIERHIYNNKSAPLLIVDVMPKGLFPAKPDSKDFKTYGNPGIGCVGTQGGTNLTLNQALFSECSACFLLQAQQYRGCQDILAGTCGIVSPYSGNLTNFFSDDTCGQKCFAGKASNYACLSKLQTYVLAIQGQAFSNDPSLGPDPSQVAAFGCTTSNIFDPTTGEKFPDYTCPPYTNQPVPK